MKRIVFLIAVIYCFSTSLAFSNEVDVVTLNNGDIYRGVIVKQKFNEFVQIRFPDKNEKRLLWKDIETVEKETSDEKTVMPAVSPVVADVAPARYPAPPQPSPDKDEMTSRYELDAAVVSYQASWKKQKYKADKLPQTNEATTVTRKVYSLPSDFTFRAFTGEWLFEAGIVAGEDSSAGSIAAGYLIAKNTFLGGYASFNHKETQQVFVTGEKTKTNSSNYLIAPSLRTRINTSPRQSFEVEGFVGFDFVNFIDSDETTNLVSSLKADGNTVFYGGSIRSVTSLSKRVSFVIELDGVSNSGSVPGEYVGGSTVTPGSIDFNNSSLAFIPLGLRVTF